MTSCTLCSWYPLQPCTYTFKEITFVAYRRLMDVLPFQSHTNTLKTYNKTLRSTYEVSRLLRDSFVSQGLCLAVPIPVWEDKCEILFGKECRHLCLQTSTDPITL